MPISYLIKWSGWKMVPEKYPERPPCPPDLSVTSLHHLRSWALLPDCPDNILQVISATLHLPGETLVYMTPKSIELEDE